MGNRCLYADQFVISGAISQKPFLALRCRIRMESMHADRTARRPAFDLEGLDNVRFHRRGASKGPQLERLKEGERFTQKT